MNTKAGEIHQKPEYISILRMDYRKIDKQCSTCMKPSEIIRINQATDGELYVSALCQDHAREEQNIIAEVAENLVNVPGTGTFVNQIMFNKLQSLDGMDAIRAAIEGDTEEGGS